MTTGVAVSVVLVNFRGTDDTLEAIGRLQEIEQPDGGMEIVVVDNASGDDSVPRLCAVDGIVLVESAENTGFAGGCNLGVRHSSGRVVAFLNNDAKPDDKWMSAALEAFHADERVGAVASRVLDWEGELVDYVGAGLTWFGMGYKPFTAEPPPRVPQAAAPVLFGTGSAMFVRRDVYDELGGFDERFFMFFEDVDLGWRLNLLGWEFRYVPESLAFHKHHASMAGFGAFKEEYLLERNALFALYKNASDELLAQALPSAVALSIARGVAKGRVDTEAFDLRRAGGDADPELAVPKITMSSVFAVDRFVQELPSLHKARDAVQSTRKVSDRALWPLFGLTDMPAFDDDDYLETYEKVVSAFDVTEPPASRNVLIITGDPLGAKLAGPAIRAWNMAAELAPLIPVRLMSLSGVEEGLSSSFDMVHVAPGDEAAFAAHESWADVIVFQGHAMAVFDGLARSRKILVVDVYDPMQLEQLEQGRSLGGAEWARQVTDATEILNEQLARGDFFLAASERQRSFWLGQLSALGRVNPANYENDPYLRNLISVVPFGLPDSDPVHRRPVLKGVVPGIEVGDRLLIWGGGIYDWFDPLGLVRAVGQVAEGHPRIKLYFLGTRHPHPGVPEMPAVAQTRRLSDELGLTGRHVFFNEDWVDYADRENYLLEADAGVSTHFAHIETSYSFRTRILDYLWAGLPMVVTRGDHFGDLVDREGLGIAVPPNDVDALADALERVLFDEELAAAARERVEAVRESYRWSTVLAPLTAFVTAPHAAADRVASGTANAPTLRPRKRRKRSGLRHDIGLVLFYLRTGGPATVVRKVRRRLSRRSAR